MKFEVNENVLNAVLNYLNSQPYGEVVRLINAIQQCKPIPQPGDGPKDDGPKEKKPEKVVTPKKK